MAVKYHEGKFPPSNLDWERLSVPLAEASDAIARYDSYLDIIPNPDILLSPMMVQEAVASSRIEGTRATVGEVLVYEAGSTNVDPEKRNDILEVVNYQSAVLHAETMMKTLPITGRVLREAHAILLQGVRGQMKSPGTYRTDQNWIGRTYDISEARYVPISPDKIDEAMLQWEKYVNQNNHPSLVKIAISHAEFESIHPFLDGNGRIGRIIVPLMMKNEGLITHPCFYLSEFFEHRNHEYQDRLLAVSEDGDWTGWCEFFLDAVATQAQENNLKARRIHDLYKSTRSALQTSSKSVYATKVIDALFVSAIFPTTRFLEIEGVNPKTGRRLLNTLCDMGIVRELMPHRGSKAAIMVFPELLEISEGITVALPESH